MAYFQELKEKKNQQVFEAMLEENFMGYSVGAEVLTTGDRIFGLIRDQQDDHWGYFTSTGEKPKLDCWSESKLIESVDTLQQFSTLIMKGLLKLPVKDLR